MKVRKNKMITKNDIALLQEYFENITELSEAMTKLKNKINVIKQYQDLTDELQEIMKEEN